MPADASTYRLLLERHNTALTARSALIALAPYNAMSSRNGRICDFHTLEGSVTDRGAMH